MSERSSDYSLELEDAVVRDDEIDITPARFSAKKRKKSNSAGGIWIPVQIVARMKGATAGEWAMISCLCRLEFKAYEKCQPLALTRKVMAEFGFTRWMHERVLSQLTTRGILTATLAPGKSPRIMIKPNLWG